MTITLNVKPFPKPRLTHQGRFSKKAKEYYAWKDLTKKEAEKNDYSIGHTLSIVFFIEMPASWSKKKKAQMDHCPHQSRPDLDNLIKAFKDALAEEDSFIWRYASMKKIWAYEPRIVVTEF